MIAFRLLGWEMILDQPGGPKFLTWQRRGDLTEEQPGMGAVMLALEMQEGLLAEEHRCLQRLETARILPELVDRQEEGPRTPCIQRCRSSIKSSHGLS